MTAFIQMIIGPVGVGIALIIIAVMLAIRAGFSGGQRFWAIGWGRSGSWFSAYAFAING